MRLIAFLISLHITLSFCQSHDYLELCELLLLNPEECECGSSVIKCYHENVTEMCVYLFIIEIYSFLNFRSLNNRYIVMNTLDELNYQKLQNLVRLYVVLNLQYHIYSYHSDVLTALVSLVQFLQNYFNCHLKHCKLEIDSY